MKRVCDLCGAHAVGDEPTIEHTPNCPNHRDAIDDTPAPPVASLDTARFYRAQKPEHASPRTALTAALEYFDNLPADQKPTHIMVLVGKDVKENFGASGTMFFQAGLYRHHAQMGLCLETMHMIRESGK